MPEMSLESVERSEMTHTPGPWHLDKHADARTVCDGQHNGENAYADEIAVIRFGPKPEALANARLIAAAPELLEALELTIDGACGLWCTWGDSPYQCDRHCNRCIQAHAAIARAKGEEVPAQA